MKKVTIPAVHLALRTFGPDGVRRVRAWFGDLADWDGDPHVRASSPVLAGLPRLRMYRTGTDTRIFFTIDCDTVTVLDIGQAAVDSGYSRLVGLKEGPC